VDLDSCRDDRNPGGKTEQKVAVTQTTLAYSLQYLTLTEAALFSLTSEVYIL